MDDISTAAGPVESASVASDLDDPTPAEAPVEADQISDSDRVEAPPVAPPPTVEIHVHGDGHCAESTDASSPDDTAPVVQRDPVSDASDEEDIFTWPDDDGPGDGPDVLPASVFQVVSEDELPPGAWPHPSTWTIPGTDWDELHEPSETHEV